MHYTTRFPGDFDASAADRTERTEEVSCPPNIFHDKSKHLSILFFFSIFL